MKTVCVSTFCEWSSYGSVMQAIGLKKTLEALGLESFIVRDVPAPLAHRDFPFVFSKNPKVLLKNLIDLPFRPAKKRLHENSVRFINEHVDIKYYNDYEALRTNVPRADHYLAGSDQIWHPALCKPAFFLDFLPPERKRLSYAASMGVTEIPAEKKETFRNLVQRFTTLSAREREVVDVLESLVERDVNQHIDPTFLLDSDRWRMLMGEYPIQKPYILVYALYWDRKLNKKLKALRRQTGYDIVALCQSGYSSAWANKKIYDADPGQFLYLIDHAQAVVSSSFHGVALALNLNKKVAAVINPSAPSRLSTLLETLQVPQCDISHVMDFDLSAYDGINERIVRERNRSITYLKEILNDE